MSYGRYKPKRGFSIVSSSRRTRLQAYTASWDVISDAVKKRDGYRCRYCGHVFPKSFLEAHHIIPVSRGGLTVMSNLATACLDCHERRPGHSHLKHRR